jgi:hypothetical protein
MHALNLLSAHLPEIKKDARCAGGSILHQTRRARRSNNVVAKETQQELNKNQQYGDQK